MFQRFTHFLKYNNLAVIVVFVIFLLGAGVFAQTEDGQELIGKKNIKEEGVDNTLLLSADLEKMNMDFKIEKIESDDSDYYVTYTYLDLVKKNNAWQYQLMERTRKISKRIEKDLGVYLGEELEQQHEDRIRDLQTEKMNAETSGEQKRKEVIEYSGLIGKTLDVIDRTFPGYEATKIRELPSPTVSPMILQTSMATSTVSDNSVSIDNLKQVYDDYILKMDQDQGVTQDSLIDDVESGSGATTSMVDNLSSSPSVDLGADINSESDSDNPKAVFDTESDSEIVSEDSVEVISLPIGEDAVSPTSESN